MGDSDSSSSGPPRPGYVEKTVSTPMFLMPKLGKNKQIKSNVLARK